ncbi:type II toxin-antitoxin system VapC family toxin [Archaeoglobus veneficus]|uniref:Ribonuclease VapC n=1 Tax=Archaeoglobus veneficus (strain DSM 11195 / SNP6) TaxID=693661 RepID=F2KQH3_ARCVS|nr:type II toxin-antitoxin system VapC family toxin [Archaeoglobus veneficus]AEA47706.1 PilT protein domain protein [Archaeoglobus veneficus SNP6]
METLCLDTDVLIDFLRGDSTAVEKIKKLEEEFELATTTINLFELYYGAYKTGKERNVRAVSELATRLEVLKFTDKSAELSGKIIAELERKGQVVDFRDVIIAGIVLENDTILYTRNVKHFERVKGVRLYKECD